MVVHLVVQGKFLKENGIKPSKNADKTAIFFAPSQVKLRIGEWGQAQFLQKYAIAWQGFSKTVDGLMRHENVKGVEGIKHLYLQTLDGKSDTSTLFNVQF